MSIPISVEEPISIRNVNLPGEIVVSDDGNILKRYFEYRGLLGDLFDIYNNWVLNILPQQVTSRTLSIPGQDNYVSFSNVRLNKPTINVSRTVKELYPLEARNRGYTYAGKILVDIQIRNKDHMILGERKNVVIGTIPIMVRSVACHLYGLDDKRLLELGECPYDTFGYFIIKGNEKVVVIHEKLRTNRFMIFNKDANGNPICKITQSSIRGTRNFIIFRNSSNMLRTTINFLGADKSVSVFYPYRVGGYIDNAIEMILLFVRPEHRSKIRTLLQLSLIDSNISSSSDDDLILSKSQGEDVKEFVFREFFFHMPQDDDISKLYLYSLMIARYCEYLTNIRDLDDRDNWGNKFLVTAGQSIETLFNEAFNLYLRNISNNMTRLLEKKKEGDIISIDDIYNSISSNNTITDNFLTSFKTSNWGVRGVFYKENITDYLKRETNILYTYSQLTRIKTPTSTQTKQPYVRMIQMSQLGYVDPVESPEGKNCGIIKHKSVTCYISSSRDDTVITEYIYNNNMVSLEPDPDRYSFIVNGRFLGWVNDNDANVVYQRLRHNKLTRKFYFDTCIVIDHRDRILYVYTDGGRPTRPLLIVDEDQIPLIYKQRDGNIDDVIEYVDAWEQQQYTVAQSLKHLERAGSDEFVRAKHRLRSLLSSSDPNMRYEIEVTRKAIMDMANMPKFTHCDLDPNAILGFSASIIPLINYNQGPRNVFQCNMGKQSLGIYHSNYQVRFDNLVRLLAFPRRPLMETQMSKWIKLNEVPAGDMVILAIMTYSGFNQEDALILNKRSVEMGKFKMVIYRRYRTIVKEKDPEFREYLGRPNPKPGENPARYRHLDNNGIAAIGSYLKEKDVVIGKLRHYTKTKEIHNASVELGIGEEGVVDRVLVTINEDNEKVVTVRVRSVRDPIIGDKFASRYAQKATVGLIVPPEDLPYTLRNGVIPDIIINPHCIPSRMTMGKMIEIVASKAAALRAQYIDGTSFRDFDINEFMKVLREYGYDSSGEEVMVDGRTGEILSSTIMIGPCYYQALRHHVKDKYFARSSRGPYKALTRQPVGGRILGGALRTGEMERDVFINHGAAGVLNERLCFSSDAYKAVFCRKCGVIASTAIQQIRYRCRICQTTDPNDLGICTIPYTFKVITDYLLGSGIKIRLNFELLESSMTESGDFDVKNLGVNI